VGCGARRRGALRVDRRQLLLTLGVAPRHQLLPGAHAERGGAEADERGPLATFDRTAPAPNHNGHAGPSQEVSGRGLRWAVPGGYLSDARVVVSLSTG